MKDAFRYAGLYSGATVGRVAGRIDKGRGEIAGKLYQLDTNEGANQLHGGPYALDKVKWDYCIVEEPHVVHVVFSYEDQAGNNGYPGNLKVQVIHSYDDKNTWTIEYQATTDQETLFNPTNHVYFNLNGQMDQPVTNHFLQLNADAYLPLRKDGIPIGKQLNVSGTDFDLREGRFIEDIVSSQEAQIRDSKGLDHPFLIEEQEVEVAMSLFLPEKKRYLEVRINQA
nr:hypothetical protein [Suicoccus acidiformans]